MNKNYFIAICVVMLFCSGAAAQVHKGESAVAYNIPFHLTGHNNIVISAVINNTDTVNLMLHTASSDITLTKEGLAKTKTINITGTVDSIKSWGGSTNSSGYSTGNRLQLAGQHWDKVTIWEDELSGQQTDGKIGLNFFDKKILVFDFDKNQLTVKNELPRKITGYQKLRLRVANDNLFIKLICKAGDEAFENEFLIHSGYGGILLFDDATVQNYRLDKKIRITGRKQLKDAYGNVLTTVNGILPHLNMGKVSVKNVPVGFLQVPSEDSK